MESLPSNFGAPHTFADITGQGGDGPGQIWDPSRPTTSYRGVLFETASSDPASGKGPFSNMTPTTSNDQWWGNDAGKEGPPTMGGGSRGGM